jgi:hypothetical protein
MMSDLQIDVVKVMLAKMMEDGHLSICTIDQILKITKGVPCKSDYDLLRGLHCISFKDYPQRLRMEFPALLQRVLESPTMDLEIKFKPQFRMPQLA